MKGIIQSAELEPNAVTSSKDKDKKSKDKDKKDKKK